jgi:hypothetical protein
MRLILFLCIISVLSARTLREALILTPVANTPTLSEAITSLNPAQKPFKVSYGDGLLTTKLEEVTMALLNYKWISNVVNTLTDEFQNNGDRKVQIFLNVKRKDFRIVYQF